MPESRMRRRAAYTPPPTRSPRKRQSAAWIAPAMVVFFVLGVLWLAVYYVSGGDAWGIRTVGGWNLLVGFGLIMIGFGLATQWR